MIWGRLVHSNMGVGYASLGGYLNLLASNSVLIESLFRTAKSNNNFFSGVEIRELIRSAEDGRKTENLLRILEENQIVNEVSDDSYELDPHLQEFLKWLLNESDLYSESHISGEIEHLNKNYGYCKERYPFS